MAIGRVAGNMLLSDLDRQSVDLQITTNGDPLFYLDFANFRAAVNGDASLATETFTVFGSAKLDEIAISQSTISSGNEIIFDTPGLFLGDVDLVHIGGGSLNYILTTNGAGILSWQDINTLSQNTNLTGMDITLGEPTDGSLVNYAAYREWTTGTKVTNAIDDLNEVMLNVYQNTFVGQVEFTADITAGPSPISVQFTPTITGNPNAYFWDFGDGNTSTQVAPLHTYSNASGGQYNVYFRAYNTDGTQAGSGTGSFAEIEKLNYITLYTPAPIPSFTVNTQTLDDGAAVILTNTSQNANSYEIFWGDGSSTVVPNNLTPGAPGQASVSHTYNNVTSDSRYNITVAATSSTAGPSGLTITSAATLVRVFSPQTPAFNAAPLVGNNQHNVVPNGHTVTFTNTTLTDPGSTSLFPGNSYLWDWGDGSQTYVNVQPGVVGNPGDAITHTYVLTDPTVEQSFTPTLRIVSGHTSSPFVSASQTVTVKAAPRSIYSGAPLVVSDRTGDTNRTGYIFTDLNGINRATVRWTNTSINSDEYQWWWGDGQFTSTLAEGQPGTPTGGTLDYTYTVDGVYGPSLLAHGPNSLSAADDTLTKASYITILPAPTAPAGLGSKVLSITSVGTNPRLTASATDNAGSAPSAGSIVNRVTVADPIATATTSDTYNATTGTLTAMVNGSADGTIVLTTASDVGTNGSLNITQDRDAHSVSPAIYPSNFYKVFNANISKTNALIPVGFNSYQMTHTTTGNTNVLGFVKDDVILAPTLDASAVSMSTSALGIPKYISGVPYYDQGGSIVIEGVMAYNWIGQTYMNSTAPLSIQHSSTVDGTTGNIIATQTKTYAQLDGATTYLSGGIPLANTGKTSATYYELGDLFVNINSTIASTGLIKMQLSNVNGASSFVELQTPINVYSTAITGFNELSIPVSMTLGSNFTDNGKRVFINGAAGLTPTFDIYTNYFVSSPFEGNIPVQGTDEAVVRFGTLEHNTENYSVYLPTGPDLSGRAGTQYFRFAFRRATVANFFLAFSGKISGLMIALPGTQVDATSTLNGWLDATQVYAGAGVPGENIANGGNGSNGCAFDVGNIVPTGQVVSNQTCKLTFGAANSSDATGNQILVCIAIAAGDYINSISIS